MTRAERIEGTLREVGGALAAIAYGMGYAMEGVVMPGMEMGDEEVEALIGARDSLVLISAHITSVLFDGDGEE